MLGRRPQASAARLFPRARSTDGPHRAASLASSAMLPQQGLPCTSCPSSTGSSPQQAGFARVVKRLPRDAVDPATEACHGGLCSRQHRLTMGLIVGLYATVGLMSLRPVGLAEPTREEARPSAAVASQPHAARRVTSGRSCASLRKDGGGWPARISAAVCSDVPSLSGAEPRPWSSARKACEKAGARLCSGAEVAAGVLRGIGINSANASAVWTGTSCGSGASYLAMRHASSTELSALLREFDTDDDGRLTKHELKAVGAPRRAASGAVRCEAGTGLQQTACCADEG